MENVIVKVKSFIFIMFGSILITSCFLKGGGTPTSTKPGGSSTATGYDYNVDEGGFQVNDYKGQPEGPNLVFIEGGRTVLGSFEEDMLTSRNNIERTVTVASFYMDETEVANIHWLEYEYYIKLDSEEVYWRNNLPDTTVWSRELAFNEPYVQHYYRYPGFRFYPVVGINWRQAVNYCKWRTDVVNVGLAEEAGLLDESFSGDDSFSEDDSFSGAEESVPQVGNTQRISLETGVVLPNYRLPTEAEWEYAAQALIGTQYLDETQTHRRLYPWDGHSLRNPYGRQMGYFLANFKRGKGDYAGIAGNLNDGAMLTQWVYEYAPNDYNLYNMAGNVNEWVQDVYRPLSFQTVDDFNPVRRDSFLDPESGYDANYSYIGNEGAYTKEQAQNAGISVGSFNNENPPTKRMRVYKGGSWQDGAYWLSPGTRRALMEDSATSTIGFRCAMIHAGTNY